MEWVDDNAGLQLSFYQVIYFCNNAEHDEN